MDTVPRNTTYTAFRKQTRSNQILTKKVHILDAQNLIQFCTANNFNSVPVPEVTRFAEIHLKNGGFMVGHISPSSVLHFLTISITESRPAVPEGFLAVLKAGGPEANTSHLAVLHAPKASWPHDRGGVTTRLQTQLSTACRHSKSALRM